MQPRLNFVYLIPSFRSLESSIQIKKQLAIQLLNFMQYNVKQSSRKITTQLRT